MEGKERTMKWYVWLFTEPDGSFSWRKAGTGLIYLVFAFACVSYIAANGWKTELPASYMGIIAGVFAAYFLKKRLRGDAGKPPGSE